MARHTANWKLKIACLETRVKELINTWKWTLNANQVLYFNTIHIAASRDTNFTVIIMIFLTFRLHNELSAILIVNQAMLVNTVVKLVLLASLLVRTL